jgi:hypothetical protein
VGGRPDLVIDSHSRNVSSPISRRETETGTRMQRALGSYQIRFSITSRAAHGQWPHGPMCRITPSATRSILARNCAECGVDSCKPPPQAMKGCYQLACRPFTLGPRLRDRKDCSL